MSGKSKPVTVSGKVGSSKDNASKSASGSYLSRQAKTRKATQEDELKQKQVVTPEDVRSLPCATKGKCLKRDTVKVGVKTSKVSK